MRKRVVIVFVAILIILIAIIFYYFFHKSQNPNILTLYGNVDVRQVDMGFRVAGQVETLCFEEGDLVKKGDLLATLNKTPYVSQVEQAEQTLKTTEASFENAKILLKRREELIGIEGVSQEDLDNARSNYNQLQATLGQNVASLQVNKDNLSFTEIFAPNEGVILTRIKEPGSVVNPSDPVYTISLSNPIWIRAYVTEPNLGRIRYGMQACVYTDTKEAPVYTGKIGFISPVAEFTPKTVETTQLRTDLVYRLRIYIDNPDDCLKQGMPVTVKINVNE